VTGFDAGIQPLSSPGNGRGGGPGVRLSRITAPEPVAGSVSVAPEGSRGRREPGGFKVIALPLLLLAASIVTTTANGARFMQNFLEGMPPVVRDSDLWPWPWLLEHPELFVTGFAFSGALLTILLTHEFGHYFACRWHGIRATLPWVIPAPALSGCAGAIIRLRSRIPSREALMDVGIYGPLAGYVVSAFAVAVGFTLSFTAPTDAPAAIVRFGGEPLTIRLIHALLLRWDPSIPSFDHISPHPILIAGWIGLFITSLNLIPAGQLDGGHVLFAVSPRIHGYATKLLPFVLFLAGAVFWVGWLLWGLFLLLPAMRHPRVPVEPQLTRGRLVLACIGVLLFLLTFTPTPFYNNSLMHFLHVDPFSTVR
jgi:hypothetical protein